VYPAGTRQPLPRKFNLMSLFIEVQKETAGMNTPELLRYLIKERFPRKTLVTASLRARSIVVLNMVAEIDPATPIVFCRPGHQFEESRKYRDLIVERLGFTNISESAGRETHIKECDKDHCERMWSENDTLPGRTFEVVHLNDTLAPYDCWISAVYHMARSEDVKERVDVDGRLIRVDPLIDWAQEDVHSYMIEHALPFHERAYRRKKFKSKLKGVVDLQTAHF
jgi:phosphoadenosine phosphosulfate reductase